MFNPLEKEKYHIKIPWYWYLIGIGIFLIPFVSFGATYGSNFLTGTTCTGFDNNTACTNAYDANLATRFDSIYNGTLPFGLSIDLGSGTTKIISKIGVNPFVYQGSQWYVKTVQTYGSNDNSTWTQIGTSTLPQSGNDQTWYYYELSTSTSQTAYRYIKYLFPDTYATNNQIYINELTAYECTDCIATSTASSTITTNTGNFMSPELDQLLIYILEGLVIVAVAWGAYKFYKS